MTTSPQICAIVAHDAGGAEVLSSYVRRQGLRCIYVLQGPALSVFGRKLGALETLPLNEAIDQADWVLCGTSWQSELEFSAIKLATRCGKRTVAFLDHWVNFRERFEREGVLYLPDEIWVGDNIAEDIARAIFVRTPIRLVENPYFLDIRDEAQALHHGAKSVEERLAVLYVCEPVREHALRQYGNERYWGYSEEDALRYFLTNLSALEQPVANIRIRPHPSEVLGKYVWVQDEFKDLPISFGGTSSLIQEVSASNLIVGCSSMAMVVGLLVGKSVICSIPPDGPNCSLPHPEIVLLRDLVKTANRPFSA